MVDFATAEGNSPDPGGGRNALIRGSSVAKGSDIRAQYNVERLQSRRLV